MTEISALPTPPSRLSPEDFAARGDEFLGALPQFAAQANALAASLNELVQNFGFAGTSATAESIASTGAKTFLTQARRSWLPGMYVVIAAASSPDTYMLAQVQSYNTGTGELGVTVRSSAGTGSYDDWNIAVAPTPSPLRAPRMAATAGATFAINTAQWAVMEITLMEADTTITLSQTGLENTAASSVTLVLIQGTGANQVSWPEGVKWSNGRAPVLSYEPGGEDIVEIISTGDGTYRGVLRGAWYS